MNRPIEEEANVDDVLSPVAQQYVDRIREIEAEIIEGVSGGRRIHLLDVVRGYERALCEMGVNARRTIFELGEQQRIIDRKVLELGERLGLLS